MPRLVPPAGTLLFGAPAPLPTCPRGPSRGRPGSSHRPDPARPDDPSTEVQTLTAAARARARVRILVILGSNCGAWSGLAPWPGAWPGPWCAMLVSCVQAGRDARGSGWNRLGEGPRAAGGGRRRPVLHGGEHFNQGGYVQAKRDHGRLRIALCGRVRPCRQAAPRQGRGAAAWAERRRRRPSRSPHVLTRRAMAAAAGRGATSGIKKSSPAGRRRRRRMSEPAARRAAAAAGAGRCGGGTTFGGANSGTSGRLGVAAAAGPAGTLWHSAAVGRIPPLPMIGDAASGAAVSPPPSESPGARHRRHMRALRGEMPAQADGAEAVA